jgi:Acetyltransferase (GNAT) domain
MRNGGAAQVGVTGYAHPAYTRALSEFGDPIKLPQSGGSLLRRRIGETNSYDAMGPYPMFSCEDWTELPADLNALKSDLVAVALVADPFGGYDEALLRSCFDRVVEFKSHLVIKLEEAEQIGSPHHRYYARRALRNVRVEVCVRPRDILQAWVLLYDNLIRRHDLKGIKRFSPESFSQQFDVPGLIAFRASTFDGECVGAHLWYVQGETAYSHLAATSELGYKFSCAYAIYDTAIEYFKGKVRSMDLGAGAGSTGKNDGLTKFKEGWANDKRTAYFCGRILDVERYRELVRRADAETATYFPAYRNGELG